MIIAQISDTHILAKMSDHEAARRRAENLRQCVAHINQQAVDVVIHTGDSVQDGLAEEYAHLHEILGALDAPYYMVPGNRDRRDALCAAVDHLPYQPEQSDFLLYTVEEFPVRLVALDSVVTGERKGVFCAERRAWLEATLAAEPDRPTILFMHHPPFDIDPDYIGGYRQQEEADSLALLVSRHPHVLRLLCGHVHRHHREPWGGTVATTMPSIAVDLRKDVDPAIDDTPQYMLHVISGDGDLVSQPQVIRQ
jgi:3',5'-cyclic AMP phosphodiesterase CpdA